MSCDWSIRPFPSPVQLDCDKDEHLPADPEHHATLRDYAHPGSVSEVTWLDGDRRTFEGSWPGYCTKLGSTGGRQNCTLPAEHHGRCAP